LHGITTTFFGWRESDLRLLWLVLLCFELKWGWLTVFFSQGFLLFKVNDIDIDGGELDVFIGALSLCLWHLVENHVITVVLP
jgi:hypothetical protein